MKPKVVFQTRNVDATRDFYVTCGFSVDREFKVGDARGLLLGRSGFEIEVLETEWELDPGRAVGIVLQVDGRAEVDALFAQATAAGATTKFEPVDVAGHYVAGVVDPNGVRVNIAAAS